MRTRNSRPSSQTGLGLVLFWLLCPGEAAAHPFSISHFRAELSGQELGVFFDLDANTASALLALDADGDLEVDDFEVSAASELVLAYLDETLEFSSSHGASDGWQPCEPVSEPPALRIDAQRLKLARRYRCRDFVEGFRIRNGTFMEDVGGHIFVADVALGERRDRLNFLPHRQVFQIWPGSDPIEESALLETEPGETRAPETDAAAASVPAPVAPGTTATVFGDYLWQGMLHIWGGIDHVLFVLTLLLGVRRWRDMALLVTSFTVAHSITLVLGALDVVPLERWLGSAFVESAIALSILYVALENLWWTRRGGSLASARQPPQRPVLTFVFGLVHGFGFSSVLREFGLPSADLVPALLAFNLGVEVGQLAIVLPVFPAVLWLVRRPARLRAVARGGSAFAAGVAVLWFIERAAGLSYMPF